ncbi:succinate--CoA ligase subunit alpha [Candidatus Bathyarchaeota archaeon]|nr:MAG: succinate--CoA ligase subunit alpha [Candidatus Bathyarchaeota archaeon]
MGIIVGKDSKVVVQGITGREGTFHTQLMLEYGTKILAGVTPGKGGSQVHGVPVYDTVEEAVSIHGVNTSIVFVPAAFTKDAALEAIDAGIKTLVIITERIPIKDTIEFLAKARKSGVTVVGPNTPGIITPPEKTKIGIMPNHIFRPGVVGIASRSGTLTYEIAWRISQIGLGQSTCVGLGGDPVTGLNFVEVLKMFLEDETTKGVVLIGEIGGNAEELAADYIQHSGYPKPVVAYVAGRTAPPGKRMGHAGAIVMGRVGTAQTKVEALRKAGVAIAETPADVARLIKEKLKG